MHYDVDLLEALKVGLISMEPTMRSNRAVGMPLDVTILRDDALRLELNPRIQPDDGYFRQLSGTWTRSLNAAHGATPLPPYGPD